MLNDETKNDQLNDAAELTEEQLQDAAGGLVGGDPAFISADAEDPAALLSADPAIVSAESPAVFSANPAIATSASARCVDPRK